MLNIGPTTVLIFLAIVTITLVADHYFHRSGKEITLGDAGLWSSIYVLVSLGFAGWLYAIHGYTATTLFLSGYLLEKILSIDNLLVFGAVFVYFGIDPKFQHRILKFGIIGAVAFRLLFVTVGAGALILLGRPVEFIFGLFVAWSAYKLLTAREGDGEVDHNQRWYIKWTRKFLPVTGDASSNRFFLVEDIRRATPLLLCMIAVEVTDVMFSFDSVPVVISVTRDPVLIYAAMVFAMMGLRSMYFVLEALKRYLSRLGSAVAIILIFIAVKLIGHATIGFEVSPVISLGIILVLLLGGVIASLFDQPSVKEA